MKFTLYDMATGRIEGVLDVRKEAQARASCGAGQAVIAGAFDSTAVRIVGGAPLPIAAPENATDTVARAWRDLRAERGRLLADCDWTQLPDAPVDPVPWRAYRQALRDLPDTVTDPAAVNWPDPPE